ncbi:MAG: hypothetical protein LHV69_03335 [Elusimicrobia bacterium]|nr:hypothetical protein [Candidatus Obscuribacterium magneticum]
MKRMRSLRFWLLCGLSMAGVRPLAIFAIQVTPGYQVITVAPGQKAKVQVTLTNTEPNECKVSPDVKNWFVLPANESIKVADWLKVVKTPFVLKPGQTKTLTYTALAPKNAVGELVGMATFLTEGPVVQTVNLQISVAIYVAVKGTEKFSGTVDSIEIIPSDGSLRVAVLMKNTGNVHLRLRGFVRVCNESDVPVVMVQIPPGRPIYPGRDKALMGEAKDAVLNPGLYIVDASFTDEIRYMEISTDKKTFKLEGKEKVVVK